MNSTRVYGVAVVISFFLGVLGAPPQLALAAWVNSTGFQVGAMIAGNGIINPIIPTATGTTLVNDPTCGAQGGTSLALVPTLLQGLKVTGVNPVQNPLALVVSCLDNGTARLRLNFINPVNGKVIAQISTSPAPNTGTVLPSTGYPHFVFRP